MKKTRATSYQKKKTGVRFVIENKSPRLLMVAITKVMASSLMLALLPRPAPPVYPDVTSGWASLKGGAAGQACRARKGRIHYS